MSRALSPEILAELITGELPSWLAAESLVDVKPTLLTKLPIQVRTSLFTSHVLIIHKPLLDICSNSISKALDDGNFLDKEGSQVRLTKLDT